MKASYFPGCTLKTKAKDLDIYARKCAEVLGVTLEEIDNWQCCGGVFTTSNDELATKLSSVRALIHASKKNQPLVSVCSGCHNVLKQTNAMMKDQTIDASSRVNNYIAPDSYNGETEVLHYLELLRDKIGFDKIKEKVVSPLTGKKIAAYYGCLLLRPGKVMAMDDVENPSIIEDLISALGAEPVKYAYRNECCGGYIALESSGLAKAKSQKVVENAKEKGAEMIITACPLCLYNLKKNGADISIVYFTELLAQALGIKE
ncbi:MAG: disulfide reductase [Clostridiales bacterium]|nr:disulfide reductase [Clostridiales bacterium]